MLLFITMFIIPMAIVLFLMWITVLETIGLPQKWRCKIGNHDRETTDMKVEKGMGFFGGPVTTFYWRCRYCGKKGIT